MPFAPEFEDIYVMFIASTLEEAGYKVLRADDIKSQQNILKDIISAIRNCDLLVADLTGANPNVYYELGLAHAFRKPVILITQELGDLPFDLRSYRVVTYDTNFARMHKAKQELLTLARNSAQGQVPFGSPVTDFLDKTEKVSYGENVEESSESDLGFLDHIVNMESGLQEINKALRAITSDMQQVNKDLTETSDKIRIATKQRTSGATIYVRKLVGELGNQLLGFAERLEQQNDTYRQQLHETRTSLEFIGKMQTSNVQTESEESDKFFQVLKQSEEAAQKARDSFLNLIGVMENLPSIEQNFNRAKQSTIGALERLVDNIDQTIAMISRARAIRRKPSITQ